MNADKRQMMATARVRKIFVVALWSAVVLLSGSVVAAWLLPQRLTYARQPYLLAATAAFYIHAFQFHLGVLVVLLTVVALAIRRWKLAGVGAVGAIIALLPTVPQFLSKTPPPAVGPTVRVMSINLLWHNRNLDWLMQGLRNGDADVIIMQEYTNAMHPLLRERLSDYPHVVTWPRDGSDGWAVYSRVPLARDVERLKLHWSHRNVRFAIDVGGREVAVYGIHLTVPKSMEQVRQNRRETADVIELLAAETRPTIVAGDFNFTETSANFAALRDAGFSSTHDLAGHGRGATWPAELLKWRIPGVRIDHVFLSRELTCTGARVLYGCGSDHRPIIADVGFAVRDEPAVATSLPAR